jgi:hypothetical protein
LNLGDGFTEPLRCDPEQVVRGRVLAGMMPGMAGTVECAAETHQIGFNIHSPMSSHATTHYVMRFSSLA